MSIFDDIGDSIGDAWDQFTGHAAAQASRNAASALQQGYQQGLNKQGELYNQATAALSPYQGAGRTGLTGMLSGLADPSSYYGYRFQNFDPNSVNVTQDPGYQFRLQQGLAGVQNSQAARGLQNSGGALKELMNYGQGLASQEYGNAYNRQYQNWQGNQAGQLQQAQLRGNALSNLANMGYGATTQANQLGQNYGNQYAAGQQGISEAKAAGIMGAQNALAGGFGNIGNLLKQGVGLGASYYTGGLSGLANAASGLAG